MLKTTGTKISGGAVVVNLSSTVVDADKHRTSGSTLILPGGVHTLWSIGGSWSAKTGREIVATVSVDTCGAWDVVEARLVEELKKLIAVEQGLAAVEAYIKAGGAK